MEALQVYGLYGFRNGLRVHLPHGATHRTHLVCVIVIVAASLILGLSNEAVTHHEPQLYEEPHGVVERGTRHTKIVSFKTPAQIVNCEMAFYAVYCIKNGISFWRLAVLVDCQIAVQDFPGPLPECVCARFTLSVVCHFSLI